MKISIVTPSFNHSRHLRQTIDSVLNQEITNLEYLVIDGGSSDGSREIIETYSDRLYYWCSESDAGQYDAINKGIQKSTGDIIGWINSSDLYLPWTLKTVEEIFNQYPDIDWISSLQRVFVTEEGNYSDSVRIRGISAGGIYNGFHGGAGNSDFIQQESCFWRRSLWDKIGGKITDSYRYAADFWLWSEFFKHTHCVGVDAPLAAFRFHDDQRSGENAYSNEVNEILNDLKSASNQVKNNFSYENLVRDWGAQTSPIMNKISWKREYHEEKAGRKMGLITGDYFKEIEYYRLHLKALCGQVQILQRSVLVRIAQYLGICLKIDLTFFRTLLK